MKKKFFEVAKTIHKKSNCRFRVGAVLVSKNRIIGQGINKNKTTPFLEKYRNEFLKMKGKNTSSMKITIHAEVDALIKSPPGKIRGSSIYVYRETKDGVPAMARPCLMCSTMLKEYGVKKMFFSCDGAFLSERI